MKRLLLLAVFGAVSLAPLCSAQIDHPEQAAEEAGAGHDVTLKWINFALLVAGLGFLIARKAPAFFNARTEEIQKAIKDATGLKLEADFRSSEIDRKIATLAQQVQGMRATAKSELEREQARIDSDTRAALERIHDHTLREIDAMQLHATREVREHAVRLATELAVTELREHPERIQQDALIRFFAADVLSGRRMA
jgi:F-type H+-transporting ATPase subunit b